MRPRLRPGGLTCKCAEWEQCGVAQKLAARKWRGNWADRSSRHPSLGSPTLIATALLLPYSLTLLPEGHASISLSSAVLHHACDHSVCITPTVPPMVTPRLLSNKPAHAICAARHRRSIIELHSRQDDEDKETHDTLRTFCVHISENGRTMFAPLQLINKICRHYLSAHTMFMFFEVLW